MAMVRLRVEVQTVRGWSSPGWKMLEVYLGDERRTYAKGLLYEVGELFRIGFAAFREVCVAADLA